MAREEKSRKSGDFRDVQEEIAYIRQKCHSLSMRGHYAECIKTIEDHLSLFYTGERWPENFFTVLRLYQKCYPSLSKNEDIGEHLAPILKKNNIPFVFANLLKGSDSAIDWKAEFFKDRAVVCQHEEKCEEALAYIDIVLKIDPRSSSAHVMRGWFLADLGRDADALKMYEEALELNPGNKHALNSVAKHYIKGNPKQALEYIEKAIKEKPDEASYYASKAEILRSQGNREGALAAIEQAIDNDPYNPDYPYRKGELYLEEGKTGAALPQYRLATALNERHVPSLIRLTELTKQNQPDLALTYVNTVVTMQPDNRDAMLIRAKLLQRLGENAAAIKQYGALLELNPDCHEALGGLGVLYLIIGDAGKAVEMLSRAIALSPKSAQYHYDKGKAHQKLGQNDDAIREYRAATAEDKGFYRAWAELGYLHAQSKPKESVDCFAKAIKLDPENAYYHSAKAELLMKLPGELNAAIESFNQACRYDPGNGELHYKLGRLLEEVDNNASAVEHYKQTVSLDPKNADAFYRLAQLQYDTHPEMALLYINSAIGLNVTNGLYLYFKGKILAGLGQNQQALEELRASLTAEGGKSGAMAEMADLLAGDSPRVALMYLNRAIELEPENAAFLCTRAHLLFQMGQTGRAREQYEKLLGKNANQHEALFGMARILAGAKEKKALGYFDNAIKVAPSIAEYHAEKAAFLADCDENYDQALEEYSIAIGLNKQAWRAILEKARLLERHGDIPAALEEYRRVLMVYRKSADAAARLGVMLADISPAHALIYLDQAIRLDQRNYRHYVWRGKVLFALGREEAAADELRTAITYGGDNADTYFTLASVLANRLPETALGYTQKALELLPDKVEILMLGGSLHFELKEYGPAKAYYEKAAALESGNHEARERLAEIAFLTGDPAMNDIAAAAHESKPKCLFCTYLKARILDEREGDTPSALSFMTRVVDLAPDVLEYREKLVELLTKNRSFIKLQIEKYRLEKLRKKLAEPLEIPPPPEFETGEEKAEAAKAGEADKAGESPEPPPAPGAPEEQDAEFEPEVANQSLRT